ncbi:hypothetical protein ACIA8H_12840 [Streptomyces goshikiensis]|uniref:hypothetical protein n=1 Tax=Streptomyces goshikiensis TaxID=1942 RepID=UPI0037949882
MSDVNRWFLEGAGEAPQPALRRPSAAPAVAPAPRMLRTNDRAEFTTYVGAWRETAAGPPGCDADDQDDVADDQDGDGWDDGEFEPLGGRYRR